VDQFRKKEAKYKDASRDCIVNFTVGDFVYGATVSEGYLCKVDLLKFAQKTKT